MCLKDDFVENLAFDQEIDTLFFDEYRDYHDMFNQKKTDEFPSHCQYNH